MQKSSVIFCVAMFVSSFFLIYFKLPKPNGVDLYLVINVILSSFILSIPSAVAFYFGVKKVQITPNFKQIIMAALFAYLLGNTTAMLLGLRDISWYLFALVVIVLSYIAPIRLLKPKTV